MAGAGWEWRQNGSLEALLCYDGGGGGGGDRGSARESLLRKRTMNTTSRIAIVGANVCPIESLDYEVVENDLFKQDWRSRKKKQIFQYSVLKWNLVLLIGLLTELVGFFNNLVVENIAGLKLLLTTDLMLKQRGNSEANDELAELPPRGWNSYDSFSWIVDENAYMRNAEILSEKLLPHGYQYAVIDFLRYRKYVDGAYTDSYGFDNIDEWDRPFPDLERFPSSRGDKGFSQIANKVHEMGLKFGIHLMKGISTQAVNANTPILDIETGKPYVEDGRQWTARDIGLTQRTTWIYECKYGYWSWTGLLKISLPTVCWLGC